ncbi:PP2C family protein-serine/threonine phosphatase [Syntrophotalea acetylenica]|uniref:Serine/threonine protein phosphatase n=2 Tax=Syntrophotalea acetylenica TaxID=29542 RepID=A0A1L3GE49_SYNAC|nr:PP2C family protein-serine/threonine phosphatase [Syntrophotalea acetylenica]APG24223.1 serine/threonine protein phosphatase [Syntrophotalea acetylenica]APG44804.1 serine/threonine protein phosphatase [Syntrophotalea acetylenica]
MTTQFHSKADLDLASEVQQLLFPKGSPHCNWCCIGIENRMARGLGGDYFDFIPLADGCEVIFLGDVTGHGLQASVIMSLLYGFIHRGTADNCDPVDMASRVNDFLFSFARRSHRLDHFFSTTLFYGVIDPATLEMRYINNGQVQPLVRRGHKLIHLAATGSPLGYFEHTEIAEARFHFRRGDRFLLYTDGLVEAFNPRGQAFGMPGLERLMRHHKGGHTDFLDKLFGALAAFGAPDPPQDDCTAIAIDFGLPGR